MIISKKTVTRSMLGFAIVIGCIVDSGRILKYQSDIADRQASLAKKQTEQAHEESRLSKAQSDSEIAMRRAQAGCVPIVLTQNNKPVRFHENLRVFDPNTFPSDPKVPRFDRTGNPINGVQPMPPGITVCNRFGDTALVGEEGAIHQIYRIEPSKLQEFRNYLNP